MVVVPPRESDSTSAERVREGGVEVGFGVTGSGARDLGEMVTSRDTVPPRSDEHVTVIVVVLVMGGVV